MPVVFLVYENCCQSDRWITFSESCTYSSSTILAIKRLGEVKYTQRNQAKKRHLGGCCSNSIGTELWNTKTEPAPKRKPSQHKPNTRFLNFRHCGVTIVSPVLEERRRECHIVRKECSGSNTQPKTENVIKQHILSAIAIQTCAAHENMLEV